MDDERNTSRCRLLELPAELRIRIYEYCLAPTGTLTLTATKSKRYATTPTLSPQLLCTNRQIYTEARDIPLEQNTICFSIDAHDTSWPVISEKRLPQRVLENLQHAAIVLDTATTFYSSYRYIDWTALTALVGLKTLRLAIVWQREVGSLGAASWLDFYEMMEEVLERIPEGTRVSYGTKDGTAERWLVHAVVERRQQGRSSTGPHFGYGAGPVTVQELLPDEYAELEDALAGVERGVKSGGVEDVFGEYRDVETRRFATSKVRVEPLRSG